MNNLSNALDTFRRTRKEVSAYRTFLQECGFPLEAQLEDTDFESIPLTSKENYISKYSPLQLVSEGATPEMLYLSSGSSGSATYWPSGIESENRDGLVHQELFDDVFEIGRSEPTLVIICFSMGMWIAGVYTLLAMRHLTDNGRPITTVSPGLDVDSILNIFRDIAPHYRSTVLVGYPPFITKLIENVVNADLVPSDLKILAGGDKFSEAWREFTIETLECDRRLSDVVNIYGSSDVGVMGHETQLSIFIRNKASKNPSLFQELFGDVHEAPGFFQFDPTRIHFEEKDGELIITANGAVPLVRYNIHDVGCIHGTDEIEQLLRKYNFYDQAVIECKGNSNWPFVVVKGRTDVALTFFAINIYPDHLLSAIELSDFSNSLTTQYVAYTIESGTAMEEKLIIEVELAPNLKKEDVDIKGVERSFGEALTKISAEFRALCLSLSTELLPTVIVVEAGQLDMSREGFKAIAYSKGKKPVMVA